MTDNLKAAMKLVDNEAPNYSNEFELASDLKRKINVYDDHIKTANDQIELIMKTRKANMNCRDALQEALKSLNSSMNEKPERF